MTIHQLTLIDKGRILSISWQDGKHYRYHAIWLRDNALDPDSRNANNGQRLISILDVPADPQISSASLNAHGDVVLNFLPDHKQLIFPASWLLDHAYDLPQPRSPSWVSPEITLWDQQLSTRIPCGDYEEICHNRQSLAHWLASIRCYGFAKLVNLPCHSGAVCDAAKLFGYVRETNYGRYFDVRTEVNPVNLAYTGMGLQAHTDNPYRDPVPTLQLLACLENSADGGDSIVVDGFHAIQILANESMRHVDMLSQYCARFAFSGETGVSLKSRCPIIELGPDGRLNGIRLNNRSIAPIVDVPYDDLADYYTAYRRLTEIITNTDLEVSFKLQPGELFIVNNKRVLHSRNAYSGAGNRWLQGCYADIDGLESTLNAIEAQQVD